MSIILNALGLEQCLFGSQQTQMNKLKVKHCSHPVLIILGGIHLFFTYSKYLFSAYSVSATIINNRGTKNRSVSHPHKNVNHNTYHPFW